MILRVPLGRGAFPPTMKGSLWTLFANKNVTHVHAVFLDAFRDLTQSGAKGAAALVHMYDNLNDAPKSTARLLAGYITLLQVI